jgi:hypothetical protein
VGDLDNIGIPTFLARVGCLYVTKGLCPPFNLRAFVEALRRDGITFSHCFNEMERHLAENPGLYRCGASDRGLPWLDAEIRRNWSRLHRPPRALPARTDRLYKRDAADEVEEGEWFVSPADRGGPTRARPADLKPIDKAGLGREPRDAPNRHPDQMRTSLRSRSHRTHTAPNPSRPTCAKAIDRAVCFLLQELAQGEVAAIDVEANARDEGIAPRTLDRARTRLKVVSRRRGFGRGGSSWLSLPASVSASKDASETGKQP